MGGNWQRKKTKSILYCITEYIYFHATFIISFNFIIIFNPYKAGLFEGSLF